MDMGILFTMLVVLAVIVLIGTQLTRFIPFEGDVKKALIFLIINVAMPCIILDSIFQLPIRDGLLSQVGVVFAFSIGLNVIGMGLGWGAARLSGLRGIQAREIAFLASLGNTGFFGLPLCAALFGAQGAFLAAVFDAGVDITLWTLAVFLIKGRSELKTNPLKSILNVPLTASIIGVIVACVGWRPPAVALEITSRLADLTVPLAMIYLGMMLSLMLQRKEGAKARQLGPAIVAKLILMPIVAITLLLVMPGWELATGQVILVQAAMPCLTVASIVFAHYAADEKLAGVATVYSTILSMATVPLFTFIGAYILF